jgi:hypothetical protein
MWHKVETLAVGDDPSNSLSINISLFPMSLGEFFGDVVSHMLKSNAVFRTPLELDSAERSRDIVSEGLRKLMLAMKQLTLPMVLPRAYFHPVGIIVVSNQGTEREDRRAPSCPDRSIVKNPLGVLTRTPPDLKLSLQQRPNLSGDTTSASSESSEWPKNHVRFDYHANFMAEEAVVGVFPAIHCVIFAQNDVAHHLDRLASLPALTKLEPHEFPPLDGLMAALLDIGMFTCDA